MDIDKHSHTAIFRLWKLWKSLTLDGTEVFIMPFASPKIRIGLVS